MHVAPRRSTRCAVPETTATKVRRSNGIPRETGPARLRCAQPVSRRARRYGRTRTKVCSLTVSEVASRPAARSNATRCVLAINATASGCSRCTRSDSHTAAALRPGGDDLRQRPSSCRRHSTRYGGTHRHRNDAHDGRRLASASHVRATLRSSMPNNCHAGSRRFASQAACLRRRLARTMSP